MRAGYRQAICPSPGRSCGPAFAGGPLLGPLLGLLLGFLLGAPAGAFELLSVETSRDGDAYLLQIEARFEAPPGRVLAVLSDYDQIHELHPRMVESRSLGRAPGGATEVHTRFEGCVLLFCRVLQRVEEIRVENTTLFAEDVPGRGSFREGRTTWRFSQLGDGALLRYEARFVPAFRIAPVIGPGILKRSVEQMTIETMAEAERRALAAE